jgi:hypothetical protein
LFSKVTNGFSQVENATPTLTTRAASDQQQQLTNGTQRGIGQGNVLVEDNGSPAEDKEGGNKLPISRSWLFLQFYNK